MDERETWLKSPVMITKAAWCFVCSAAIAAWMTSHAASAFPEWRNVNSYGDDTGKLPWQIIWTQSDGNELDVRAAEPVFHRDVPGVTPPVVDEHSEPSSFLRAPRGGVCVGSDRVEAGDSGVGVRYLLI